jgi:hypothetical protein
VLSITAVFLIAIPSGRAYAAHELLQAENDDHLRITEDAELMRIAIPTRIRAEQSFVGHDIRTLEFQIGRALGQAPGGTCELKFYGAGVVAICE